MRIRLFAGVPVASPSFSKPTVALMVSRRIALPVSTSPASMDDFAQQGIAESGIARDRLRRQRLNSRRQRHHFASIRVSRESARGRVLGKSASCSGFMAGSPSEFAVRPEPNQPQGVRIRLLVDQHQVGLDVTVAKAGPFA